MAHNARSPFELDGAAQLALDWPKAKHRSSQPGIEPRIDLNLMVYLMVPPPTDGTLFLNFKTIIYKFDSAPGTTCLHPLAS